jgi:DNA-binding MarR family transcriptional regulator
MEGEPDDRRMIGALLRIPREAAIRQVMEGLARAGFGDLRPAHFTVFQHLPSEGVRLTALAEAALLTKQSMGYLVDDLEELGYVERAPDPTDRRAKVLRLTTRGHQVDDTVRGVIRQIESDWAERMGQENFAQLVRQLRALIAILGE